jgi:hypothetical protein
MARYRPGTEREQPVGHATDLSKLLLSLRAGTGLVLLSGGRVVAWGRDVPPGLTNVIAVSWQHLSAALQRRYDPRMGLFYDGGECLASPAVDSGA